jgi:hypothetical protein
MSWSSFGGASERVMNTMGADEKESPAAGRLSVLIAAIDKRLFLPRRLLALG